MPLTIACPGCGQKLSVSDAVRGKRAKCGKCGGIIQVPAAEPKPQPVETDLVPLDDDPLGIGSVSLGRPVPRPVAVSPLAAPAATHRPAASGSLLRPIIAGVGILGALVLLGIVVVVVVVFRSGSTKIANSSGGGAYSLGGPTGPLDPHAVPVPAFPELGQPQTIAHGVQVYFVDTRLAPGNTGAVPGSLMRMRVYVPAGEHAPRSLPCVLVAPAGTPLICGNDVDAGDYHDEALPYARASMVAICYSLDGPGPDSQETIRFVEPYKQFKAAGGGVVNGRNALEFALQKISQVDPQRIYCAGHSSAGTVSLLLAAHEPRIKACLAYAPCTDVELRMRDLSSDWTARRAFPGIADFLRDTSPRNHLQRLKCPVFVCHAMDDDNEPFATTTKFVKDLHAAGKDVFFHTTMRGGHYQSMIDEGIPNGIHWLKNCQPGS